MKPKLSISIILLALFISCVDQIEVPDYGEVAVMENSDWKLKTNDGAKAKLSINDGGINVQVSAITENDWDVRLAYKNNIYLRKGIHYRLSFEAWSDQDKTIRPDFNGYGPGEFTHYTSFDFAMEVNTKHEFFKSFVMEEEDDEKANLDLFIGREIADIWIDNVCIEQLKEPTVDVSAIWDIYLYNLAGEQIGGLTTDFIQDENGKLKVSYNNHLFEGYISDKTIEASFENKHHFIGTVNETEDEIAGKYFNYEENIEGSFVGTFHVDKIANYSGAYNLSASYKTAVGSVNNETDVLTISQNGKILSIAGNTGASGTIEGDHVTISGDILPGDGKGAYQVFTGKVTQTTMFGSISGSVMMKDAYGELALRDILEGEFYLSLRK